MWFTAYRNTLEPYDLTVIQKHRFRLNLNRWGRERHTRWLPVIKNSLRNDRIDNA